MKPKLTIELVPSTSWYKNMRSISPKSWDLIRSSIYKRAKYRCEVCGNMMIRTLLKDWLGLSHYLRYGPNAGDLAENSSWRKTHDSAHWILRQRTITSEKVRYDFEGLRQT